MEKKIAEIKKGDIKNRLGIIEEKKNIFESGKTAYHCNKCGTNMMLYTRQPKKCPCVSTDLKQLSKKELDQILKEDKNQVYVIIGVYSGVINDVEVFYNDTKAADYEKTLCKKYKIPFNQEERNQYYDSDVEHEVKHFITRVK